MPELKKLSEFGFSRGDILSAEEILKTGVPKKRDIIAKYGESVAMAVKWILLLGRETGVNVIKEPLLLSKIRAGIMKIPGGAGNLRIETARRVFLALVSEPIGVPEGISCPDMFAEWEKSPDVSEVLDAAIVDKTMFFQNFGIYIHSVFLDESENKDDTVLRSIVGHLYRKGIGANGLFKILSGLRESAIRTYYKNNSKAVNDRFIYMMERMLSAYSVIAEEDRVNSEENARKTAVFENNERMYVEALNQSAIVQEVSTSGDILYANDLTEQITGWTSNEVVGKNVRVMNSGVHPNEFWRNLWRTVKTGETWVGDICNRRKDGSLYWTSTTIVPFVDVRGCVTKFVCVRHDITEQRRMNEELRVRGQELELLHKELTTKSRELEEIAKTDTLTKLGNRTAFDRDIKDEIARALRGRKLSAIMFDIDHFKRINDTLGHDAGDDALRKFGMVIKSMLRGMDKAYRLGGEEFFIVLPDSDSGAALKCAERIRKRLEEDGGFTVSGGVVEFKGGDTPESLTKRADILMYDAKRGGRNNIKVEEISPE